MLPQTIFFVHRHFHKQSNVDQLQLLHLAPLQVISRLHSLNFQNCRLTKSGAAHLDTYQRASIKLLPSECQIYVLAGSACRYQIGYFRTNLLIHRQGDGWIMNVERPKNGTKRASILHSWLISKWTWASRHIFRIFLIHTHSTQRFPHLGLKVYICQISPNRRLPSVGPCWVFGHWLSHAPSFLHILLSCENFHWLFVGSVFFLGMLKSHLKPVLFIG